MINKAENILNKKQSINHELEMKQLLLDVGALERSNKIKREEAKKRGELFNIFEVLGVQTNETVLHSSFLASLLNPYGSHGLSYKPLELFLRKLKEDGILKFEINYSQANIETEYSIGNITSDYTQGGRMDILLKDGNNFIGIENKIDAGDQETQLVRYHNFLTKEATEKGEFLLIYLTKYGSSPSKSSITDPNSNKLLEEGTDFYVISYKDFILNWLEECRHLAIDNVKVREIIKQYQETIKNITGMNYSDKDKERLMEILIQHIPAVNSIISNAADFRDYLFIKKIVEPMKEWAANYDLKCIEGAKHCDGNQGPFGLSFYKKDWNTKMIRIEYSIKDLLGFSGAFIGICWKEIKGNEENSEIIPGYKSQSLVFPNGYKNLEKKYRSIEILDLEDDLKVNHILDHYKEQILYILNHIKNSFYKYNM